MYTGLGYHLDDLTFSEKSLFFKVSRDIPDNNYIIDLNANNDLAICLGPMAGPCDL